MVHHGMLAGGQLLMKNKGKTLRWNREKFEESVLSEGNKLNVYYKYILIKIDLLVAFIFIFL